MLHGGIDEFVQGAEAAAGKNQLPTDLRIAAAHEAQQFDLLFGVRRKIGMAAFGGNHADSARRPTPGWPGRDPVPAAISARVPPGSGPCPDSTRRNLRSADIRCCGPVAPRSFSNTTCLHFKFFEQIVGVHRPGQIGGAHAIVDHRAGDAETRGANSVVRQVTEAACAKIP